MDSFQYANESFVMTFAQAECGGKGFRIAVCAKSARGKSLETGVVLLA
jgi:hypothetical protein